MIISVIVSGKYGLTVWVFVISLESFGSHDRLSSISSVRTKVRIVKQLWFGSIGSVQLGSI